MKAFYLKHKDVIRDYAELAGFLAVLIGGSVLLMLPAVAYILSLGK